MRVSGTLRRERGKRKYGVIFVMGRKETDRYREVQRDTDGHTDKQRGISVVVFQRIRIQETALKQDPIASDNQEAKKHK